jgi:hypothetical protein
MYGQSLKPIADYQAFFSHCGDGCRYILEASPRYVYGKSAIAQQMNEALDNPKIVILLRDPVGRMFSFFNHRKKSGKIPWQMSFGVHVKKTIDEFSRLNSESKPEDINLSVMDKYDGGLVQGIYIHYLDAWFREFGSDVKVCFFEHLKSDPNQFMADLCQWLNIDADCYSNASLEAKNSSQSYRYRGLLSFGRLVNERIIHRLGPCRDVIQKPLIYLHNLINTKENNAERMSESSRATLTAFYKEHNKELRKYLQSKGYDSLPNWLQIEA